MPPTITTNGKPANGKARSPFAGRRVYNYSRPQGSWMWHPALRDGRFSLREVPAMMMDNAVSLGLLTIFGPLFGAKHEVRANSKEIKTFVENTLYRFWHHDLMKVLEHYVPFGTSIGEVMYEVDAETGLWKYAGLDDFDLNDVQALKRGRHLTGARVSYGSTSLYGIGQNMNRESYGEHPNELRHPKLFWCGHRNVTGRLFGKSCMEASWAPWMEKVGAHGALSIRKLWAFSNAFRGCWVRYPAGGVQRRADGTVVDNQDVAREIAEAYCTGAAGAIPSEVDEHGNQLWEIVDPHLNGEIKGLMEYPDGLNREIWQGMGVLDEVIHAPDTGGSWSGRSGPLLIFLNIEDMRVREITTAFDVGPSGYTTRSEQSGGVIRPLVMENFGPKAKYEIRCISLVPKPAEPGAGGTPGSAPGAATGAKPPGMAPPSSPMGAPPGPTGMGGPPKPAVGPPPVRLSSVELPDDEVEAILGLSAAFDEAKHPRGQEENKGEFAAKGAQSQGSTDTASPSQEPTQSVSRHAPLEGQEIANKFNGAIQRIHKTHRAGELDADDIDAGLNQVVAKAFALVKRNAVTSWREMQDEMIAQHGDTPALHSILESSRRNVKEALENVAEVLESRADDVRNDADREDRHDHGTDVEGAIDRLEREIAHTEKYVGTSINGAKMAQQFQETRQTIGRINKKIHKGKPLNGADHETIASLNTSDRYWTIHQADNGFYSIASNDGRARHEESRYDPGTPHEWRTMHRKEGKGDWTPGPNNEALTKQIEARNKASTQLSMAMDDLGDVSLSALHDVSQERRDELGRWTTDKKPARSIFSRLINRIGRFFMAEEEPKQESLFAAPPAEEIEPDRKERGLAYMSYTYHVDNAKDTLSEMGAGDLWSTELHRSPTLRSFAVRSPQVFDRRFADLQTSLHQAGQFTEGNPAAVESLRVKTEELGRLKDDVARFRASQSPEVLPDHFGKRGAGAINTKAAIEHLADGGDVHSAVRHVMKFGGIKEATAKKYVRAALKEAKKMIDAKIKEKRDVRNV